MIEKKEIKSVSFFPHLQVTVAEQKRTNIQTIQMRENSNQLNRRLKVIKLEIYFLPSYL